MKMILRNLLKKLLGPRYQSPIKSLIVSIIVFTALKSFAEKLPISFGVFILTITVFAFSIAYKLLGSDDFQRYLKGQFMLPYENRQFNGSLFLASSLYVMITKAIFVLTLYLVVMPLQQYPMLIAGFFLAGFAACGSAMAIRVLSGAGYSAKGMLLTAVIGCIQVSLCLLAHKNDILYFAGQAAYLLILGHSIRNVDSCKLLKTAPAAAGRYKESEYRKFLSMFAYFLRYMVSHRSYIINTLIMWSAGCFLTLIFGEMGDADAAEVFIPLGLAVLAVNTPLGILISSDKSLHKKIALLPNQRRVLLLPYGIFVLAATAISYTIFLTSWKFLNGSFHPFYILCAVLFALQNALLTVLLEQNFPIENWFVETDLWHNPRKYVAPGILLLQGTLIAGTFWGIGISVIFIGLDFLVVLSDGKARILQHLRERHL